MICLEAEWLVHVSSTLKNTKNKKALLFILRHLSCIPNPKSYFLILIAAFVPSVRGIIMYKWQAR